MSKHSWKRQLSVMWLSISWTYQASKLLTILALAVAIDRLINSQRGEIVYDDLFYSINGVLVRLGIGGVSDSSLYIFFAGRMSWH